jgi:CDP-glucose 4,6-dehydratase
MNPDFWKGKKVLVTGGSGFLGRWLVRALLAGGAEIHVLDVAASAASPADYIFHGSDLLDLSATTKTLAALKPDVVIHLAGQPGVSACHDHPLEAFASNVVCTLNLLAACRSILEIKSIVAVSSNHVYGEQEQQPTPEDAPLNGAGMYATSKLCGDVIARCYGKTYGLPVSIARITNSYGGDDPHAGHIITATILAALKGERAVVKQSGKDTKGYLYVKDTVNGILVLAERTALQSELYGEAFNFVPDEPISVIELVRQIGAATGLNLEPEIQQPDADHEHENLDNGKARRLLDWRPEYSLQQGLIETVDWYRTQISSSIPPTRPAAANT